MRKLNGDLFAALESGELSPLLALVKSDHSLCIELRGDTLNVYYRGGSLMKVEHGSSGHRFHFDKNYGAQDVPEATAGVERWLAAVPRLKHAIDLHGVDRSEREAQQLLLRENNFGRGALSTDYYVCDIEYNVGNRRGQFDMVGVHWPSTERKKATDRRLVFVEMKYGEDALGGASGIESHIADINGFLSDAERVQSFKADMVEVFNQKRALGIIKCNKDLESFSDASLERPLILLVLVNQSPVSRQLGQVLAALPASPMADLRVANGSFMGYGLWEQRTYSIEEVKTWLAHYSGWRR